MADIQPTDQFLVNRSDSTQTVDHADLMASLQDTDLMLINRSDTTYTITGEDLKDSLKPELTLTVVLSTYDAEVGGEITATGIAGGGTPPFTYAYQWQKAGVDIAGAINQKYTPVLADVGSKLKCVVVATDDDGDDITAASPETNDVVQSAAPPAVSGATLAGGPGFSGKTYTTTLQGYDPGIPAATQGLKAKVTGALSLPGETSAITNVTTKLVSMAWLYTTNLWTLVLDRDYSNEEVTLEIVQGTNTSQSNFGDNWQASGGAGNSATMTGDNASALEVYDLSHETAQTTGGTLFVKWLSISGNTAYVKAKITGASGSVFTTGVFAGSAADIPSAVGITGESTTLTLTDDTNLRNGAFQNGDTVVQSNSLPGGLVSITDIKNANPSEGFDFNFHFPGAGYDAGPGNSKTSAKDAGLISGAFFYSNTAGRQYENWCGAIIDPSGSTSYQTAVIFEYTNATVGTPFKVVVNSASDPTLNIVGEATFTGSSSSVTVSGILPESSDVGTEVEIYPTTTSGSFIFSNSGTAYVTITGLQAVAAPVSGTVAGIAFTKDLPVTPVSSPITGVAANPIYSDTSSGSSLGANPEFAFNGDLSNGCNYNTGGAITATTSQVTINSSVRIYTNALGGTTISLTCGGQTWIGDGTGTTGWLTLSGGTGPVTASGFTVTVTGAGAQIRAFEFDGTVLIDGQITLTLQNDKDLDVFQPGDVVQEEGTPTTALVYAQANDETIGSYFNYFVTDPELKTQGWKILDSLDETLIGTTFTFSYFVSDDGIAWSKLGNYNSTETPGNPIKKYASFTIYGQPGVGEAKISLTGLQYAGTVGTLPSDNPFGSEFSITAIDEATPSITTDGGTWNTGEVVTGQERPVPTPGNYMDLSDATAGWTVGEKAINTVANPVTIKPLTSEIVGVSNNILDYAAGISSGVGGSIATPENAFDGDTTTSAQAQNLVFTYSFTGVTSFRVNSISGGDYQIKVNGTNVAVGASDTQGWTDCLAAISNGTVSSVELTHASNPALTQYLYAIEVNGSILVDGSNTTLNFSNDTDLAQFVASDDVYQDGGYQPQSSAITGVADKTEEFTVSGTYTFQPGSSSTTMGGFGLNNWKYTGVNIAISNDNSTVYEFAEPIENVTKLELDFKCSSQRLYCWANDDNTGNWVGYKDVTSFQKKDFTGGLGSDTTLTKIRIQGDTISDIEVRGIYVNGVQLLDGMIIGTTLTLLNTDGLENFRVGDSVGVGGATTAFAPVLYKGNGSSQSIDVGFAPDLVWIKARTDASSHQLVDTVRGPRLRLSSDNTNAELDASNVTVFNPNGFTVGDSGGVNGSGQDYVAWCWKASGSTVTNNAGTLESQVRAGNGFSIVSYTGDGSSGASTTVGHGLGKIPSVVLIKRIDTDYDWLWHQEGERGYLNLSNAFAGPSIVMTDATFSLGSGPGAGADGGQYIAYCWAETATSSFGSFTGTGSSTGNPVIECGFEPAFVLWKKASNSGDWVIFDNARSQSNPRIDTLFPNKNSADNDGQFALDFTSTGFQVVSDKGEYNGLGDEMIYAAFAAGAGGTINDITGNTMTLADASGFEVGKTVTGPETTAATGIVASTDPAAKTMTLSTSDETPPKRWIANGNRKVTMDEKPAVQSTAFLEFSGTQVTGLTSADPGYKPADPSLQLTFTDPAPTGSTWDQELPAGTYMQTRVLGTNDSGTADTGWSNRAVGRGLSPSADMQEAYLEASARLLTHQNRAEYHQGQLALQARADVRIKIAQEMGITIEELDVLLGEED